MLRSSDLGVSLGILKKKIKGIRVTYPIVMSCILFKPQNARDVTWVLNSQPLSPMEWWNQVELPRKIVKNWRSCKQQSETLRVSHALVGLPKEHCFILCLGNQQGPCV